MLLTIPQIPSISNLETQPPAAYGEFGGMSTTTHRQYVNELATEGQNETQLPAPIQDADQVWCLRDKRIKIEQL